MGNQLFDIILYMLMVLAGLTAALLLKALLARPCDYYEQRIRELKETLKEQRERYENLLKDAAVKNVVMTSLHNAWRSGELKKCYQENGEVRVLMDGTVLCEKGEQSYAIEVEEVEEP